MDPFTIATSIASLVLNTGRVVKQLHELHTTIKDAPMLLRSITSECTLVYTSLGIIQQTQLRRGTQALGLHSDQVYNAFDIALEGCALIVSVLEKDIQDCLVAGKNPQDLEAVRRCKIVFEKNHLQELVFQLRGQQQALTLLLSSLQSQSIDDLKTTVQDNRDVLHGIARRARRLYADSERSSTVQSRSIEGVDLSLQRNSVVSSTRFEFDAALLESRTYQRQLDYLQKLDKRRIEVSGEDAPTQTNNTVEVSISVSDFDQSTIGDASTFRASDIWTPVGSTARDSWLTAPKELLARPDSAPPELDRPETYDWIDPEKHNWGELEKPPSYSKLVTAETEKAAKQDPKSTTSFPAMGNTRSSHLRPNSMSIDARRRNVRSGEATVEIRRFSTIEPPRSKSDDTFSGAQLFTDTVSRRSRTPNTRPDFTAPKRASIASLNLDYRNAWHQPSFQHLYPLQYVPKRKVVFTGDECAELSAAIAMAVHESGESVLLFPEYVFSRTLRDDYTLHVNLDGRHFELAVSDTTGQEAYGNLIYMSYEHANVLVIGYAVDHRESFENAIYAHSSLRYGTFNLPTNIAIVLVGNKVHLRKNLESSNANSNKSETLKTKTFVSYEEGLEAAQTMGAAVFVECSPTTGEGISELFEVITKCCVLQDVAKIAVKQPSKKLFDFRRHKPKPSISAPMEAIGSRFSIIREDDEDSQRFDSVNKF